MFIIRVLCPYVANLGSITAKDGKTVLRTGTATRRHGSDLVVVTTTNDPADEFADRRNTADSTGVTPTTVIVIVVVGVVGIAAAVVSADIRSSSTAVTIAPFFATVQVDGSGRTAAGCTRRRVGLDPMNRPGSFGRGRTPRTTAAFGSPHGWEGQCDVFCSSTGGEPSSH